MHTHLCIISAVPTNCTWNFSELITTSSSITISLIVSACAGPTPTYQVQASSIPSGAVIVAQQVNSFVYEISSLTAATAYDVQLVDTECPNVVVEQLSVVTDTDPSEFVIDSYISGANLNPLCLTMFVQVIQNCFIVLHLAGGHFSFRGLYSLRGVAFCQGQVKKQETCGNRNGKQITLQITDKSNTRSPHPRTACSIYSRYIDLETLTKGWRRLELLLLGC